MAPYVLRSSKLTKDSVSYDKPVTRSQTNSLTSVRTIKTEVQEYVNSIIANYNSKTPTGIQTRSGLQLSCTHCKSVN